MTASFDSSAWTGRPATACLPDFRLEIGPDWFSRIWSIRLFWGWNPAPPEGRSPWNHSWGINLLMYQTVVNFPVGLKIWRW